MQYSYRCENCGAFDSPIQSTAIQCRCGRQAKRNWQVALRKPTWKGGHYNPQVGRYVSSESEWKSELQKIGEREEAKLGQEVRMNSIDIRDSTAVTETYGITKEQRDSDLEPTRKRNHDQGKKTTSLLV